MKPIHLLAVLAAIVTTLSSASAQTVVPVTNFSFENPSTGAYTLGDPTSWAYSGNTQDEGVQTFANGGISPTGSADGSQLYFLNSANGASVGNFLVQDVGSLLANTTYSLTVAEAVAPAGGYGSAPGDLELALFNGIDSTGTLLDSRTDALTPSTTATGSSADYTLVFTTGAAVTGDLTIGLGNETASGVTQGDFDNVRLTETSASIPEPSTYAMLAGGVLALMAVRRRFQSVSRD